MQFHLVKEMDEVIPIALDGTLPVAQQTEQEGSTVQGPERVAHQ
jgi:hypothetical protein